MAYGQQNSNNSRAPYKPQTSTAVGTGKPALLSTGLFKPENGKSKAIGTVKLKEGITIPAGSYINLYEVENRKDTSPVFRLQVREAVAKK